MTPPLRVAVCGAGWISAVHVAALRTVPGVEVVAVADLPAELGGVPAAARYQRFAEEHGVPRVVPDYRELLEPGDQGGCDLVVVGFPNAFHARVAIDCARAGKHLVVEKPLCLGFAELQELEAAVTAAGVVCGYAEELCFVPKYVRAKELIDAGAVGTVFHVRQREAHGGPYSPWFFDRTLAGGGITMDMGCHSIECCRWLLGKPRAVAVTAHMGTYVHRAVTRLEDHVVITIEFENGAFATAESAWTLKGGMVSVAEVYGDGGSISADMLKGTALSVHSERGFAGGETGWQQVDWEWAFQNGYPQEMAHFVACARSGATPRESIEDAAAVLEIMLAAYHSAGTGRRVALPFRPRDVERPVDLWLAPRPEL
ncbi:MAG TPA: Gfo/Idh/MocA family oxidoreductase [Polyangia bacterium]